MLLLILIALATLLLARYSILCLGIHTVLYIRMILLCTQNLKDFYNLVNVYLDAVLHPSLTPWTLKQEGWHYEVEKKDEPLTYKGVVFNEMKGVYSSPDAVHGRAAQQVRYQTRKYILAELDRLICFFRLYSPTIRMGWTLEGIPR